MKAETNFKLCRDDGGEYIVTTDDSQKQYPTLGAAIDSLKSLGADKATRDKIMLEVEKSEREKIVDKRNHDDDYFELLAENSALKECIIQLVLKLYGGNHD